MTEHESSTGAAGVTGTAHPAGAAPRSAEPIASRLPLLFWWHLGVTAALVIVSTVALMSTPERLRHEHSVAITVVVPVLLALVYVALGRAALRRAMFDQPALRVDSLFLALVVLLVAAGAAVNPNFASLQALAYPFIWSLRERYRDAIAWSAALAIAVTLGLLIALSRYGVTDPLLEAGMIGMLSFVFSVAMGTWITRIFLRGERYRELAERLRDSQAEVADLSLAAGAAAERERLSHELHDTLTQTLTGLVMLSEQAEHALNAGDQARAEDRLARVSSAAREAVAEARALVATTQPLADGGLAASIERVAERLRADTGLRVHCELQTVPLAREHEVLLLRSAQEGMANARKHARAHQLWVTLAPLPRGGAALRVEDDGVGPGAADAAPAGFGLSGLAMRVRALGGEVSFGHGAHSGSRLEVRLPVTGAAGTAEAS